MKGLCHFHIICVIIYSNPLYVPTLIFLKPILILSFHLLLGLLGGHFSKDFLIQILCTLLTFVHCKHCSRQVLPSDLTQGVQSSFIALYTVSQQACDSPLGDTKWYSVLPCSRIYWQKVYTSQCCLICVLSLHIST